MQSVLTMIRTTSKIIGASILGKIGFDFSESENAVDRVALTIENLGKWGAQWIVFPNAVYGSSANYAMQYGFAELFDYFDYTDEDSAAWEMYD